MRVPYTFRLCARICTHTHYSHTIHLVYNCRLLPAAYKLFDECSLNSLRGVRWCGRSGSRAKIIITIIIIIIYWPLSRCVIEYEMNKQTQENSNRRESRRRKRKTENDVLCINENEIIVRADLCVYAIALLRNWTSYHRRRIRAAIRGLCRAIIRHTKSFSANLLCHFSS